MSAADAPRTTHANDPDVDQNRTPSPDPIAVVGVSCRFPGAGDPDEFWTLLSAGTETVGPRPSARWDLAEHPDGNAGYLDRVDLFDAEFFKMSPREAAATDPQQRLLLELAWEALENANVVPASLLDSTTAVYAAAIWDDYAELTGSHRRPLTHHSFTGTRRSMLANRISRTLGLTGPSLTVDTGQSSSLVAVHLACEALRRGEATAALVGGVNLIVAPQSTATSRQLGAMSPTGRCRTFDSRADGYVRGEGGAVLVLKPLSRARADGDRIHSVLLGSAVNHDGGGEPLGVPHREAQEQVLRLAHANAGTDPSDVQYVELHGTATPTGDQVEAAALGAVVGAAHAAQPLRVGSVKTNIGHLEGAAGIAGLLKTILSVANRELVPSLHYLDPPAGMPLDELALRVQTEHGDWPAADRRLIAGVSSFGLGGTNCHLVIAEPETDGAPVHSATAPESAGPVPLLLSGNDQRSLRCQAARLHRYLEARPNLTPATLASALATTRTGFAHRAAVIGTDRGDILTALDALSREQPTVDVISGTARSGHRPVFVFPGQGTQWTGMARELAADHPVFAEAMDECARALEPHVDWDLWDVLDSALERADTVQPALWAVMVSLARLWRSYGVEPAAVIGHSQGELAAAVVCGALSLPDAARIVALRGEVISRRLAGAGGMISMGLPADQARTFIAPWSAETGIAAVNSPTTTVVSGETEALDQILSACESRQIRAKRISVDYASHSSQVEDIQAELRESIGHVETFDGDIPFYSTVTGGRADGETLDARYWVDNLRRPVRFDETVRQLIADGHRLFIEASPHPVLTVGLHETFETVNVDATAIGTLRRHDGGTARFVSALAEGHVCGLSGIDWSKVFGTGRAARLDLPTYPFQRSSHWLERGEAEPVAATEPTAEPSAARDDTQPGMTARDVEGQRRHLLDLVRGHAAVVLGHTDPRKVAPDVTFKDAGFDSVMSVQLRNSLNTVTGLRLPTAVLFSYPTPLSLAEHIRTTMAGTDRHDPAVAALDRPVADTREPIAIVGVACRFPGGVRNPDDLWDLVSSGTDAIGEFPRDRGWDLDNLFDDDPDRAGTSYVNRGGFLYDAAGFDAGFFGISPREALVMDPQQRFALEASWEAVESAGIDPSSLKGSDTAVYLGVIPQEYAARLDRAPEEYKGLFLTGRGTTSVLSGRVSYVLGLRGPAVSVDTACSSSLVGVDMAVKALRRGDCHLAVAGGVTIMPNPGMFVEFSRQRGLAADGRCKSFANAADGTSWGEGVGVLVLQRLSEALEGNRPIWGVIRGSAVNQDGASNGLTAPSQRAQEEVIHAALADAGLDAADVDAVEAHGTGTALGDPIEAEALIASYGAHRNSDRPLWLGSLKSNVGHTQAAAGVGGIIKLLMALRHEQLPATLHVDTPSPHVDWSSGSVALLESARPWPVTGRPRRAAVSSFGISGTNTHVVVEEPPTAELPPARRPHTRVVPLILSGRSAAQLSAQAERLLSHVEENPDLDLRDVGHALATTRTHWEHRAAVLADNADDLTDGLKALANDEPTAHAIRGVAAGGRVGFLFTGQGSQRLGMGRRLYDTHPAFAAAFDRIAEAVDVHLDRPLRDIVFGDDADLIHQTRYTQPALFAIELALFELFDGWGVRPDVMAGHSIGQITAACAAGVMSLADACLLVTARGRLMQQAPAGGAMVAIHADEQRVREALVPGVDVAAVNSPGVAVISGDADAVHAVAGTLRESGAKTTPLTVSHAFHSPHMDAILADFEAVAERITYHQPEVPVVSTLTGTFAAGDDLRTARYWSRHIRHTVNFRQALRFMADQGVTTLIEIGPDAALTTNAIHTLDDVTCVPTMRGNLDEDTTLARAIAHAHVAGVDVDWRAFGEPTAPRPASLPTTAFQHQHHWFQEPAIAGDLAEAGLGISDHPLIGAQVHVADTDHRVSTGRLSLEAQPWLSDHRIRGTAVVPATVYVELALHAGHATGHGRLEELTLHAPLWLPEDGGVQLQVAIRDAIDAGRRTVVIHSRPSRSATDEDWHHHATGVLTPEEPDAGDLGLNQWPPSAATPIDLDGFYDDVAGLGYEYGPAFRGLTTAWRAGEDVYAEVVVPAELSESAGHHGLHPALLDAALHGALIARSERSEAGLALPYEWSGVTLFAAGATALRVRVTPNGPDAVSIHIADQQGRPVARVESLIMREVADEVARAQGLFRLGWVPVEAATGDDLDWRVVNSGTDLASLPDPVGDLVVVDIEESTLRDTTGAALRLIQEFLGDDRFTKSRMVFVIDDTSVVSAAVVGLVRSAVTENPQRFGLLHVHGRVAEDALSAASRMFVTESEVSLRGDTILAPRLTRSPTARGLDGSSDEPWCLDVDADGTLTRRPAAHATAPLGSGQVRIRVAAAGLNFRDVIVAMGMVSGLEGIGLEGAGTITETGPDVSGLSVGDKVMGLFPRAMGSVAVADVRTLVPLPSGWTGVQGASAPVAFLTSWMGLAEVGGLRRGERVLIHAATGGVGLAALQVARHLGAEVFATASPGKQHILRQHGLDDEHIASSRTLEFRDRFRATCDGAGVDVVLNSLAGEFSDASLDLLSPGGRFVELGKTDVRDPDTVAAEHPGVAYRYFDLATEDPERIRRAFIPVARLLTDGTFTVPVINSWDIRRANEAFALMRSATHIGKIVLTSPTVWDPTKTVLITGGTGTLGGLLARHLVTEHGVRHLLLAGRRGGEVAGAAELAAELAAHGATVTFAACDVSDRAALARLLATIPDEHGLDAVIHAAGVIEDSVVESMTPTQLERVLGAKAEAARHLDELTAGMDLSAFVLFSSVAGTVGTGGQANYAAANAYLDRLAQDRRERGLAAVSLAWGMWKQESGMTGHLGRQDVARFARYGLVPLTNDDGLAHFDAALAAGDPGYIATNLDTGALRKRAAAQVPALLRGMIAGQRQRVAASAAVVRPQTDDDQSHRLAELPAAERERALLELVRSHTATVLQLGDASEVAPQRTFRDAGVDSLTGVELRNRLHSATGLNLPSTVVFRFPTPAELAEHLGDQLPGGEDSAATALADVDRLRDTLTAIASDAEHTDAVMAKLRELLREFGTPEPERQDDDISSATDDEMFALIDRELGLE